MTTWEEFNQYYQDVLSGNIRGDIALGIGTGNVSRVPSPLIQNPALYSTGTTEGETAGTAFFGNLGKSAGMILALIAGIMILKKR